MRGSTMIEKIMKKIVKLDIIWLEDDIKSGWSEDEEEERG